MKSNYQVCIDFLNRTNSHNRNVSASRSSMYSYRLEIARWKDNKLEILDVRRKISLTTTNHVNTLIYACHKSNVDYTLIKPLRKGNGFNSWSFPRMNAYGFPYQELDNTKIPLTLTFNNDKTITLDCPVWLNRDSGLAMAREFRLSRYESGWRKGEYYAELCGEWRIIHAKSGTQLTPMNNCHSLSSMELLLAEIATFCDWTKFNPKRITPELAEKMREVLARNAGMFVDRSKEDWIDHYVHYKPPTRE